MKIELKPIGVVHCPYKHIEECTESTVGEIEVFKEYEEGLKDIDGFFPPHNIVDVS